MPKQSQKAEINNFAKGLITEATPLNFPSDAAKELDNFVIRRNGAVERRLGMDVELGYFEHEFDSLFSELPSLGHGTYVWTTAGGKVGADFVVTQVGIRILIFRLTAPIISAQAWGFEIPIFDPQVNFSFADTDGRLIIVSGKEEIAVVEHDTIDDSNPFHLSYQRLKVRDVWGIEIEGSQYETDPMFRGSSGQTPNTQIYNLQNQSWGVPRKNFVQPTLDAFGATAVSRDPLEYFYSWKGVYPSNSETVYGGLQYQVASQYDIPSERMYPTLWDDVRNAYARAAKGYFVIDLLRRGSSRIEQSLQNKIRFNEIQRVLDNTKADYSPGGAKVVSSFAGRVFYSGFDGTVLEGDNRSPDLSNMIFFSQLVKSPSDIGKCYQEGDPTSREGNDLVDTDGGFIKISNANNIVDMVPLGSTLIIFADNGVWSVSGGNNYGFSATNYKVDQISKIGVISKGSIVEEIGKIFYWSSDGIYVVGYDNLQNLATTNITEATIQSFFETIPSTALASSKGVYDPYDRKVRWLLTYGTINEDAYNRELIFDTVLKAFYPYTIANANNQLFLDGIFVNTPIAVQLFEDSVLVDEEFVTVGTEIVTAENSRNLSRTRTVGYTVLFKRSNGKIGLTFASYNNGNYLDWGRFTGYQSADAAALLVTGHQTTGDSSIYKQIPYLTFHMQKSEEMDIDGETILNPSSCYVRGRWDFTDGASSNRWSGEIQVYRPSRIIFNNQLQGNEGYEIITTKNKLRGRGRAFALQARTEPAKACTIIGWNLAVNGNAIT